MDFTWYERQIRVKHKIKYIFVLHLVFQAKKNFSALARENFRTTTHLRTRKRKRNRQTDNDRKNKELRREENDGGVVSRAFVFPKIEV